MVKNLITGAAQSVSQTAGSIVHRVKEAAADTALAVMGDSATDEPRPEASQPSPTTTSSAASSRGPDTGEPKLTAERSTPRSSGGGAAKGSASAKKAASGRPAPTPASSGGGTKARPASSARKASPSRPALGSASSLAKSRLGPPVQRKRRQAGRLRNQRLRPGARRLNPRKSAPPREAAQKKRARARPPGAPHHEIGQERVEKSGERAFPGGQHIEKQGVPVRQQEERFEKVSRPATRRA